MIKIKNEKNILNIAYYFYHISLILNYMPVSLKLKKMSSFTVTTTNNIPKFGPITSPGGNKVPASVSDEWSAWLAMGKEGEERKLMSIGGRWYGVSTEEDDEEKCEEKINKDVKIVRRMKLPDAHPTTSQAEKPADDNEGSVTPSEKFQELKRNFGLLKKP